MPRNDYAICKVCKRHRAEVGPLSHTRLCSGCATERLLANIAGLHYHRGPAFQRWREGMAASVGATLATPPHGE